MHSSLARSFCFITDEVEIKIFNLQNSILAEHLLKSSLLHPAKSRLTMLVPFQSLGLWDNVGVPRKMWGTQQEPGPEWYNNATATK